MVVKVASVWGGNAVGWFLIRTVATKVDTTEDVPAAVHIAKSHDPYQYNTNPTFISTLNFWPTPGSLYQSLSHAVFIKNVNITCKGVRAKVYAFCLKQ